MTLSPSFLIFLCLFAFFVLQVREEKVFFTSGYFCLFLISRPPRPRRISASHHALAFQAGWSNREKHMRDLTCWAISFDKQSVSGICIVESDVAFGADSLPNAKWSFHHVSENTKGNNREGDERDALLLPLHASHNSGVHPSSSHWGKVCSVYFDTDAYRSLFNKVSIKTGRN